MNCILWATLGCLLLMLPMAGVEPGVKIQAVGGTITGIVAKAGARLDFTGSDTLVAQAGQTAAQMREILLSTLQATRLFVVTEKEDRADAVLRGGAEDLVYSEVHSSSDSVNSRADAGTGRSSSNTKGAYMGMGAGLSESE